MSNEKKITIEDYKKVFNKLRSNKKIPKDILQWCDKIDEEKKQGHTLDDYAEYVSMLETAIKVAIMNKDITYKEAYIVGDLYGAYGLWENCYVRER